MKTNTLTSTTFTNIEKTKSSTIHFDLENEKALFDRESNHNFRDCTGDQMLACIEFQYTELGWTSVILWVASAFDPPVVASVAVACAILTCIIGLQY